MNSSKSSNDLDKLFRQKSACSTGDEDKVVIKMSDKLNGSEDKKERNFECASQPEEIRSEKVKVISQDISD